MLITDLAPEASSAILARERRAKGKWRVLPYEMTDFKGQALSVYPRTNPPRIRVPLPAQGWHAVYVGLCTTPNATDRIYEGNAVRAKLGSATVYRRLSNTLKPGALLRDVVQEQFLTVAHLPPGETLDLTPFPLMPATVMYVRLVPLTDTERLAWEREARSHRTNIATNDGHSWIWPYQPRELSDLLQPSAGFEHSDFAQWWFCPLGADLVTYPTKVGTVASEDTTDFFRSLDEEFDRSIRHLLARGVNPLLVARKGAADAGQEFHFVVRPQAFGASMPYEETFNSRFYRNHPEWRCVDRQGRQAMYMSYAIPAVRKQVLDVIREAVESADPDGVGFFFNRGVPLMLWEKAFSDRFMEKFGFALRDVPAEDDRIHALRSEIMTECMRELRAMLDQLTKKRGGRRYTISVTVFTNKKINDTFGLDVARWSREGLIDQLALAFAPTYFDKGDRLPDMSYFRQITAGTSVRIYPMVTAWDLMAWHPTGKLTDFCRLAGQWYEDGAAGIAVWDPENGAGFRNYPAVGDSMDLLRYLGNRELIRVWARDGVPIPQGFPIVRLGENEYSEWLPNRGY